MEFGVSQASTVRRMLFATSFLPPDIPNYWEMVATFASDGSVSPQQAKLKMENVQMLDSEALLFHRCSSPLHPHIRSHICQHLRKCVFQSPPSWWCKMVLDDGLPVAVESNRTLNLILVDIALHSLRSVPMFLCPCKNGPRHLLSSSSRVEMCRDRKHQPVLCFARQR